MDIQVLRQVPLFAALPQEELTYLASALPQREVAAQRMLFREGEPGDMFYVVLAGTLAIVKAVGTPDERLLGIRHAGEFIGEMSLVSADHRRTASVRTETSVRLLEISRAEFEGLLMRQPALAYQMVRVLSARLRESEDATIQDLQVKTPSCSARSSSSAKHGGAGGEAGAGARAAARSREPGEHAPR
jgi:CRP-like cAMP-binding protein